MIARGSHHSSGRPSQQRVLVVTMVGVSAVSFAVTILSAVLPTIADDFDTSYATATWTTVAPLVVLAAFTPAAGKFGDLIGHRRAYLIGMAGFAAGSVLTALSWNIGALIAARTITQAFGTIASPAAMASVMAAYPPHERTKPLGTLTAATAISPAIGVVAGGPLIDLLGWRLIFGAQATIAVAGLLAAVVYLPSSGRRRASSFDLPGAATLGVGISGIVFAANRGAAWGFDHPAVQIAAVLGPIGIAAFVFVERRARSPLVPLALLRDRSFGCSLTSQLILNAAYMGATVLTPLLLDTFWGYGAWAIAMMVLPRPAFFAVGSAVMGSNHHVYGGRRIVLAGMVTLAVGSVLNAVGAANRSIALVLLGSAISGLGNGATRPALIAAVGNSVDAEDLGIASGTLNMSAQLGAALGVSLMTAFVDEGSSTAAFGWTYGLAAGIGVVAALMSLGIDWTRTEQPASGTVPALGTPRPEPRNV